VDVVVLDKLMNLVGELVLARSQIADVISEDDAGRLAEPFRHLRLVTSELQDSVMQARLQSVGTLTAKFHRLARDLAGSLEKKVRLETTGDDVGVDKGIHEALRDPLVHLVRNAIDHGIESPAERIAAGKDPEGRLRIAASHRGDRIHIEISDDGRGIDPTRLVASALGAGLLSPEAAESIGDAEALNLMFVAGLSTKEQVSNISGRGVGMDVVRASLNNVGGAIEVSSRIGHGTVFRIDVPLTLAIMPTVLVWSGGDRYAIPRVYVQEVVYVDAALAATAISAVGGARIMRRPGGLLALIELADHLGVTAAPGDSGGAYVVIVTIGGRSFGIVVDEMGDSTEVVVKPLTAATQGITIFAGVTILSNGRPSLIIDLDGLANAAGLMTVRKDEPVALDVATVETESLLVATTADGGRLAVPLAAVRRLEQFPSSAVERTSVLDLIQYEGTVLPLLYAAEVVQGDQSRRQVTAPREGLLKTVVCESSLGLVGLVVATVEDVVSEVVVAPRSASGGLVTRRVIVGGRVTELVDVEMLIAKGALL
jgi:two-component system chemotaxis sensor kinase CheA